MLQTKFYKGALAVLFILLSAVGASHAQQDTSIISVTPNELDFGTIDVGDTALRSVTIRNNSQDLQVITLTQPIAPFFIDSGLGGGNSFTLARGTARTIRFRFEPVAPGESVSPVQLTAQSLNSTVSRTITLMGEAVEDSTVGGDSTRIRVQPTNLNFGPVDMGDTARRFFTITNSSTQQQQLVGVVGPARLPFIVDSVGAFNLAPGASRTIGVTFVPTADSTFLDSVQVFYNRLDSANNPVIVRLRGVGTDTTSNTGDTTRVTVTPRYVDFGMVRVGDSRSRSITIRNNDSTLGGPGVTGFVIIPPSPPFVVTSGTNPTPLPPSSTQTIIVQFTPTGDSVFMDTMQIIVSRTDNLGGVDTVSYFVVLRGEGTLDTTGGGGDSTRLTVTPTSLEFGEVNVGSASTRTLTLRNNSGTTTSGNVGSATTPFLVTSGTGAFVLQPGEVRVVVIQFTPTQNGDFQGNLPITYSDSGVTGVFSREINVALHGSSSDSGGTGSVRDINGTVRSNGYSLSQTRPNPAGGMVTIDFVLPKAGEVSLNVYNMQGELVATLVDGSMPAGQRSVSWDVSSFESGVYVYRLVTEEMAIANRMTVTR